MAWYHVGECDCPVGNCDCGDPVRPDEIGKHGSERFAQLLSAGCMVTIKNNGHHWIIRKGETRVDYWPSKERFRMNLKKGLDRGYGRMLKYLGVQK